MNRFFFVLFLFPLVAFSQGREDGLVLISSGKSPFSIVVPVDAIPSEEYAAAQLQYYLSRVSGVKLDIINEAAVDQDQNYIFVGLNNFVEEHISKSGVDSLGKDGIIIKTTGSRLIISGGRPRGTLNAVYHFLEEYIGCRWWTPTDMDIPETKSITLDKINEYYIPPFKYRNHFIYNTISSPKFAAVLHENGDDQKVSLQQGGNEKILGFVHTFSKILPPEKYFSKHPEWYSDPNNNDLPCTSKSKEPAPQQTQLCLTNKQMYQEFLKNTLMWIAANPSYGIISISQNDYRSYCQCESCKKIVEQEDSPSGLLLQFVNRIAADIEKIYPEKKIETLAYYFSLQPPKITRPRKNVIIRIAPIQSDWAYALNSPQNKEIKEILVQWSEISDELYYWGYNTNFIHLMLPHPSFGHVGEDLKFLAEKGFTGIFMQDNKYTDGFGYFLDMKAWVVGHLMWDPSLDQQVLVKEFMDHYYGAGGYYLSQYIQLMEKAFRNSHKKLSTFNRDFSFLTLDVLNKGTLLFDKALSSVEKGSIYHERIQKEKTVFDFAWLVLHRPLKIESRIRNEEFLGPDTYTKDMENFFERLKKYKVKRIDRKFTNEAYQRELIPLKIPNHRITSNSITIQQEDYKLYRQGSVTDIVRDRRASDKKAATITGNSKEWAVRVLIEDYSLAFKDELWRVSACVKVNPKNHTSLRDLSAYVNMGMYNPLTKKSHPVVKIPLSKLSQKKYLKAELPAVKLTGHEYFWFSLVDDKGEVEQFLLDRIELKKIK
jgi:hypothetical protein